MGPLYRLDEQCGAGPHARSGPQTWPHMPDTIYRAGPAKVLRAGCAAACAVHGSDPVYTIRIGSIWLQPKTHGEHHEPNDRAPRAVCLTPLLQKVPMLLFLVAVEIFKVSCFLPMASGYIGLSHILERHSLLPLFKCIPSGLGMQGESLVRQEMN